MADDEHEEQYLKFGDLVSFSVQLEAPSGGEKQSGYLTAKGILDSACYLTTDTTLPFDDCVFKLCVKTRVSASAELKEYEGQMEALAVRDKEAIEAEEPDPTLAEEQQQIMLDAKLMRMREKRAKMLATLERVKRNEAELNAATQAEMSGTAISYGDTVQLLHVNSGKWLTVDPDDVANTERENLKVYLDTNGDSTSWFKVMPGTAVAREGSQVENWSEVVFGCALGDNQYLHHSEKFVRLETRDKTELREINCSLEKVAWRMQLYTAHVPDLGSVLTAGTLVYLLDPGSDCYLRTLDQREAVQYTEDENCVFFANNETPRNSGGLWLVETPSRFVGGSIQRVIENYYLRNLNTGKYIKIGAGSAETTQDRSNAACSLTLQAFSNVGLEDDNIRDGDLIQVQNEQLEDNEAVENWLSHDKLIDGLDMSRAGSVSDKLEATCFVIRKAADETCKESRTALAAFPIMQNLAAALSSVVATPDSSVVNLADLITVLLPKFDECAKTSIQLIDFIVDGKVNMETGKVFGEEDVGVKVLRNRQKLLKEQSILDVMLDILESCNPLVKRISMGLFSDSAVSAIVTVCKLSFKVLRYSSMRNTENQLYIADRFHVMISYLDTGSLAMQTLSEMLNTNPDIQEDKVGEKEVEEFIEMLRRSTSKSSSLTIIELLKALCSCQGEGIDSNQCMLADQLLTGKAEDLLYRLEEKSGSIRVYPNKDEAGIMLRALAGVAHKQEAEFLVAQLYLFAEMCFDRNYIAMQRLMDRLPYTLVTKAVADRSIVPKLRGAFVKLASSLYVDTKPQESFNVDNRAFCWSKINAELPSPLVAPENGVDHFVALKAAIQTELDELANPGSWSTCTMRIADLLQNLIDFSFYSRDELMMIMRPLIDGLDQYNNADFASAMPGASAKRGSMMLVNPSADDDAKVSSMVLGPEGSTPDLLNASAAVPSAKIIPEEGLDNRKQSMRNAPRLVKKHAELRKRVLGVLDWLPFMCFILGLVFVAITAAMIDEFSCSGGNCLPGFMVLDVLIFCVFAAELIARMWAVGDMKEFFTDPFATVDFVVVCLDILAFALGELLGAAGGFGPILRAIRFVKLVRVLKAARVLKALHDEFNTRTVFEYKAPLRYTHTSEEKVKTMMAMVRVLTKVLQIANSWRLSIFLTQVRKNMDDLSDGDNSKDLVGYFKDTMEQTTDLTLANTGREVDDILLDLCLYHDTELVQQTINLLMLHHQPWNTLLRNTQQVQLMVHDDEERLFLALKNELSELQRQAESEEIWGALEEPEHVEISERVKTILRNLTNACKLASPKLLMSRGVYAANETNQNMIRNLGGFNVVLTVLQLKEKFSGQGDEDDEDDDEPQSVELENTRAILQLNSAFLCWLVHDNPANQEIAFQHLPTFLALAPLGLGATSVMVEILRDNEKLIKLVPHDFLQSAIRMIVRKGRVPHYLDLLDVLTHIGDYGMTANQIEVVRQLTRQEYADKLLYLPGAPGTPMFEERAKLMNGLKGLQDADHTSSSRNPATPESREGRRNSGVGGSTPANILRAVPQRRALISEYASAVVDHSDGLSSNNHLPVALQYHTKLLHTLAGCAAGMINIVEAKVQSLYSYQNVLHGLLDESTILEVKLALSRFFFDVVVDVAILVPGLCEDDMVWRYFASFPEGIRDGGKALQRLEVLNPEDFERYPLDRLKVSYLCEAIAPNIEFFFSNYFDEMETPWKPARINKLISDMFAELKLIYERNSQLLLPEHSQALYLALEKMREVAPMRSSLVMPTLLSEIKITKRKESLSVSISEHLTSSRDMVRVKYEDAINEVKEDPKLLELLTSEKLHLINYLKTVPKENEKGEHTDVRYEVLLRKLVDHIHDCIEVDDLAQRKTMTPEHTDTAVWVIRLFRGMIEHEWGFSIEERDDEGDEKSDEKVKDVQDALNECGATRLCLSLISIGINPTLRKACVRLLVALLYREGGCLSVQTTISETLKEINSDYFFAAVKEEITSITKWHEDWAVENENYEPEDDEDPEEHEMLIVVRFLQLMCEGHYEPNQDLMRGGVGDFAKAEFNLLDLFVNHITQLQKIPSQVSTHSMNAMLATILEVIQGPCVGNQIHFAINTEILEILNRLIRDEGTHKKDEEEEEELRETTIMIFKALLEGQANPSQIYQRVLSVLHVEVLALLVVKEKDQTELNPMQVQTMVLLQMLMDYDPALSEMMDMNVSLADLDEVVPIEVIWNGTLQRRFFAKDDMCKFLSDPSKDTLVEFVDRTSPETKLQDFVIRCRALHIEMKHQKFLESHNLSRLFSPKNQNLATWIAFWIAFTINCILICTLRYEKDETGKLTSTLSHAGIAFTLPIPPTYLGHASYAEGMPSEFELKEKDADSNATFATGDLSATYAGGTPLLPVQADPTFTSVKWEDLTFSLNVVQLGFSLFTLLLFWVVRVPVNFQVARELRKKSLFRSIYLTATDGMTLYYVYYVIMCVLAIQVERDGYIFTAMLLLDIIVKNSTTKDVLLAVYYPARQLMATAILGVFTIYIFSFIIFLRFREDVADDSGAPEACDALWSCMMLTMNFGMRLSGGVGDYLGMDAVGLARPYTRFILDMLYFLVVLIVLLNIIFGIIIDTFSDLRVSKLDRLKATTEKCFICDLDKLGFDRASPQPNGFRRHIKNDHYMWNYFNFMIFLWEQDQDDDDGLELYVRKCLEENDLSWFPMNTAMCLQKDDDDGRREGEDEIKSQLVRLGETMEEKIAAQQESIASVEKSLTMINGAVMELLVNSDPAAASGGGRRLSNFRMKRGQTLAGKARHTSPSPTSMVSESAAQAAKLAKELDLDHPEEGELGDVDV